MAEITAIDFQLECDWLNEEYKKCFGAYPEPKIEMGVMNYVVATVMVRIYREHLKEIIEAVNYRRGS